MMDPMALAFVAHLLTAHIAVPEPVTIQWMPIAEGFEYEPAVAGDIELIGGRWILRLDQKRWDKLSVPKRRWLLAHELCHAVHTYGMNWNAMTDEQRRENHKLVDQCANFAIRQHLMGVNH